MDDLTIAAIRRRLQTKITDLVETNSKLIPAAPVTIANDERQLGFSLPPLMTRRAPIRGSFVSSRTEI
jgi:hypothetical protein